MSGPVLVDLDTLERAVLDAQYHEFPSVRRAEIDRIFRETRAARAAAPPVEPEHALHYDPSCEECVHLAPTVEVIHVPPSPAPVAGLREALDAWERNGAPNRRSLAAFGIRPILASDKPGLPCKGVCEYDDAPHHHKDGAS